MRLFDNLFLRSPKNSRLPSPGGQVFGEQVSEGVIVKRGHILQDGDIIELHLQ